MTPSTRQLHYLLTLKQYLNFSKAAKACFVSQSTLSAGINKLEECLNVQLVERNNKSVLFTPIGEKVVKQAQKVIFSMQDLVKISCVDFFQSSITIGVIPTISTYLLPEFMARVQAIYPKLEIIVLEDTSQNLLTKVERLELDFAIFAFPFEEFDNIKQHSIFQDDLVLVKHKGWLHKEIGKGDLLLLEQGHCLRTHIINNAQIRQNQISDSSCTNLETLVAMIQMKIGVSFLPKMAIESGILDKYPDLVTNQSKASLSRNIGLIYRNNHLWEEYFIELGECLRLAKRT